MAKELSIRYKNTLRHLLFLLLGFIGLIIGLVTYYITANFLYFYLVIFANLLIVYVLFKSQTRKNKVVYDAVFVKYRINEQPTERIKIGQINNLKRIDKGIKIQIDSTWKEIDLHNYSKESVDKFYALLASFLK